MATNESDFYLRLLGVIIFVGIVYAVALGLFIAGPSISFFD